MVGLVVWIHTKLMVGWGTFTTKPAAQQGLQDKEIPQLGPVWPPNPLVANVASVK